MEAFYALHSYSDLDTLVVTKIMESKLSAAAEYIEKRIMPHTQVFVVTSERHWKMLAKSLKETLGKKRATLSFARTTREDEILNL